MELRDLAGVPKVNETLHEALQLQFMEQVGDGDSSDASDGLQVLQWAMIRMKTLSLPSCWQLRVDICGRIGID